MPDPKDNPKSPEWRPYIFARDQWHCRICGDRFLYSEIANTLLMSTTRPCHQACMSTSRAQFGSERNSHRRLRAASRSDEDFSGCFEIQNDSGLPQGSRTLSRGKLTAEGEESPCPT